MGDAAGIGPEIIVKALSHKCVYALCQPLVIGSAAVIRNALRFAHATCDTAVWQCPTVVSVTDSHRCPPASHGRIDVLDVSALTPETFSLGTIAAKCGSAAVSAVEHAVQLTLNGALDGITTAPICKAAIQRAGSPYLGHTEMLADLTQTPKVVMMLKTLEGFADCVNDCVHVSSRNHVQEIAAEERALARILAGGLTVSFVTNHIPLASVAQQLSVERIRDVIEITHAALCQFGVASPRLVLAGLNPHAGEAGMLGNGEEETYIIPAIRQAQASGYHVDGPLPADTLFIKAARGEWDAVIAMYHDQGNIPIKLLGFGRTVNITLGLPIVRTSVDHGTAFDIAGKGIANETSLIAALAAAAQIANSSQQSTLNC